jgi:ubiquinone/menaquinone biosynthesis C-methylase UbiE
MSSHEIEQWSPLKVWFYSLLHGDPKSNAEIVSFANVAPTDRFLDIGCGPGAGLEYASRAGAEVAGVDPSAAMVERAAKRAPNADVRLGSAEEIPFADNAFTVAINVSSFHHWADREAGLREIRRVLEPGGRLHVVEGKLKDGRDGHGLDLHQAQVLTVKLGELGYSDMRVDEIKTGRRHEYIVVSAQNPI